VTGEAVSRTVKQALLVVAEVRYCCVWILDYSEKQSCSVCVDTNNIVDTHTHARTHAYIELF